MTNIVLVVIAICFVLSIIGTATLWIFGKSLQKKELAKLAGVPLKFPNDQSQFKEIQGSKIHFLKIGKGPDILLIHGLGANVYCWRKLIPLLAPNFCLWAVDLKGFGLSDKPRNSSYSLETHGKILAELVETEGVKKMTVVGNSLGGAIAAQLALDRPDLVENIVLINSAHDPKMFGKPMWAVSKFMQAAKPAIGFFAPIVNKELVSRYMPTIYGQKDYSISDDDVRAYVAPYLDGIESHLAFVSTFQSMLEHKIAEKLNGLKMKVLILWGKYDNLLPVKFGESLHKEIQGSSFFLHPTGGHHLQEEDPVWVAEKIKDFLRF